MAGKPFRILSSSSEPPEWSYSERDTDSESYHTDGELYVSHQDNF